VNRSLRHSTAGYQKVNFHQSDDRNHPHGSTADKIQVFVLGPHPLQNQLLAAYIHASTGMRVAVNTLADWHKQRQVFDQRGQLYLIDAALEEESIPWPDSSPKMRFPRTITGLFNIESQSGIEGLALKKGIRGVFYKQDDADTLIKGIKAMMAGELWFSRKVASRLLWNSRHNRHPREALTANLTQRETEILSQLALGCSNQHIADSLCISLHTVKTHLHNIYRKIGVDNRLQASLWATRFLAAASTTV
jgi:LuxR family transcriptional regulator of csgAB operon